MLTATLEKYCGLFLGGYDRRKLEKTLKSSPVYPSLWSVMDALNSVGLNVAAVKSDIDSVKRMNKPVLLHLDIGGSDNLVIARNAGDDRMSLYNPKTGQWKNMEKQEIQKHWDGVVIFAEGNPKGQPSRRVFMPVLISLSLILLSVFVFLPNARYALPVFAGLFLCSYLEVSRKSTYRPLDRLCHINSKSDCGTVTSSDYAGPFGLSLNGLALSYYLTQGIVLMFSVIFLREPHIKSIFLPSLVISIPVGVYSIYGQIKVKHWCPVCLLILLSLWAESVIFLCCHDAQGISPGLIVGWSIVFVMTYAVFHLYSKSAATERELLEMETGFLGLKRKESTLLSESKEVPVIVSPIWYGDSESSDTVTTVVSPDCPHCRKAVGDMIAILDRGLGFRWNIILGAVKRRDEDMMGKWIGMYVTDREGFLDFLRKWSDGGSGHEKYTNDETGSGKDIDAIKGKFNEVVKKLGINSFPVVIFNDRLLSSVYRPEDVEYLIRKGLE